MNDEINPTSLTISMVNSFFHTLEGILKKMAAMLKIHVASTCFLQSDPEGTFLISCLYHHLNDSAKKLHLSDPLGVKTTATTSFRFLVMNAIINSNV